MFQSVSAYMPSTACFLKPGFCNNLMVLWVTCFNQHLPLLALLPDFKHQVVLQVTCFNHVLLICPQRMLFKTRVLQQLNGFTGAMFQSAHLLICLRLSNPKI
jgi:hypothetical protein